MRGSAAHGRPLRQDRSPRALSGSRHRSCLDHCARRAGWQRLRELRNRCIKLALPMNWEACAMRANLKHASAYLLIIVGLGGYSGTAFAQAATAAAAVPATATDVKAGAEVRDSKGVQVAK